jgi:hypothetical protein
MDARLKENFCRAIRYKFFDGETIFELAVNVEVVFSGGSPV